MTNIKQKEVTQYDKNFIYLISLFMAGLQTIEEKETCKFISQKAQTINGYYKPISLYPLKAQNIESGMMLWNVSDTSPKVKGIVYYTETISDITEVHYLCGDSEILSSTSMVFSCCRPELLRVDRRNKDKLLKSGILNDRKSLLDDKRNKDLKEMFLE